MMGVLGGEKGEERAERLLEEMLAETSQGFMINNLYQKSQLIQRDLHLNKS